MQGLIKTLNRNAQSIERLANSLSRFNDALVAATRKKVSRVRPKAGRN